MSNSPATRNFGKDEKKLFDKMLEMYDNKENKSALKNADIILEKYPLHAETMAFKALILNALKRKTEAYDLVKKALFKNMGNFTCWHVYGILNRGHKKFDDARKAYIMALKADETNVNVLRDLSLL